MNIRQVSLIVVVASSLFCIIVLVGYGLFGKSNGEHGSESTTAATTSLTAPSSLLSLINVTRMWDRLQYYTHAAHMAGTPQGYDTAVYTVNQLQQMGLDANLVRYDVLLSYPLFRNVTILSPRVFTMKLTEPALAEDPTSFLPAVPTFSGYSGDGSVTAEVLYCNYGLYEDFVAVTAALTQAGQTTQGKIALVRYGKSFRGSKVKHAEMFGFGGVLIYSDPANDGAAVGQTYMQGPWRPMDSVQRGSLLYIMDYPGDPRTPGYASVPGAPSVNASTFPLPTVPVQPLSAADALPLMFLLSGGIALPDPSWQGGLGFAYSITGASPVVVNLQVQTNRTVTPIFNVIAKIPGQQAAESQVVIGNHRDAWAFGAVDPSTGSAALLEVANALAGLRSAGWTPLRSITIASWDAEEFGLIGSTEWAEDNEGTLLNNTVAYFNVDASGFGPSFSARASPSMQTFLSTVTSSIPVDSNTTIWDTWQQTPAQGMIEYPGSGSDFSVFLQHLGVAIADLGFEGSYGVYHSIYDSYEWMKRFHSDVGFAGTAQVFLLATVAMADAVVLPLNASDYAASLTSSFNTLQTTVQQTSCVTNLDLTRLQTAIGAFSSAATTFSSVQSSVISSCSATSPMTSSCSNRVHTINEQLRTLDASLTNPSGLTLRPWFRHVVFAADRRTGYAASVFPGIVDALYACDGNLAAQAVSDTATVISSAALKLST